MALSYKAFKENPLMYILFLPLLALTTLFYMLNNQKNDRIKDKDVIIQKIEQRETKTDSINHNLYEILGAKKILDTLKIK
jgi:uncharacterized protein Yka (UPF0111/DUF47 family)